MVNLGMVYYVASPTLSNMRDSQGYCNILQLEWDFLGAANDLPPPRSFEADKRQCVLSRKQKADADVG